MREWRREERTEKKIPHDFSLCNESVCKPSQPVLINFSQPDEVSLFSLDIFFDISNVNIGDSQRQSLACGSINAKGGVDKINFAGA